MNLVIGYGEIGKAIGEVIGEHDYLDVDVTPTGKEYAVMHICIPFTSDFVKIVKAYMAKYKPKHVIVYSTVPIGTCEKIGQKVVHSPVEGRHPDLALSINTMERWIGTSDKKEGHYFTNFFEDLFMRVKVVTSSKFTEALKLLSTAEYGVNIAFADYKADVAEQIDMPYDLTKEWNLEYNRLYRELGLGKRFQKYVLDAPSGTIGGHCVVPNAKLLNFDYPDDMLDIIEDFE